MRYKPACEIGVDSFKPMSADEDLIITAGLAGLDIISDKGFKVVRELQLPFYNKYL